MRLLIATLLVLLLAIGLATAALDDTGYVVFSYRNYVVETSFTLFVLAFLVLVAALYLAVRLAVRLWGMPRSLGRWSHARHVRKAEDSLAKGFLAMAEGNWHRAERLLVRHARHSPAPLMHYLGAAQAAQRQNALERRDTYLRLAHETGPDAELAVSLAQAELQLRQRQPEQALATLTRLQGMKPGHAQVLRLLMQLYRDLGEWGQLVKLLPDLKRHKVLGEDELHRLGVRAYGGQLEQTARAGDGDSLGSLWSDIPKRYREDPQLIARYVQQLRACQRDGSAEVLLRNALRRDWNAQLAALYGEVQGEDGMRQLAEAEKWLPAHEQDPELLVTLGRLSFRNKLWGKARSYLETAVKVQPSPEAFRLLADTLEEMGDSAGASRCSRQGLALATDRKAGTQLALARQG